MPGRGLYCYCDFLSLLEASDVDDKFMDRWKHRRRRSHAVCTFALLSCGFSLGSRLAAVLVIISL